MKEVLVNTDLLLSVSGEIIFFNSLERTDVNRANILCGLEEGLFLVLNRGYVVQQREHVDGAACRPFL